VCRGSSGTQAPSGLLHTALSLLVRARSFRDVHPAGDRTL